MTDQIPAGLTREGVRAVREWALHALNKPGASTTAEKVAARVILNAVPTPTPPTLADMTPEERAECQWMQADVKEYEITAGIIAKINPTDAHLIASDGETWFLEFDTVTPRSDLPRLEWPGTEKPDPGPALPDGWRAADHKDNGRVIVTNTTPNRDGYVCYVLPADDYVLGYDWLLCKPYELTYLGTDDTRKENND